MKQVIDLSKKIVEDVQWKNLEKNIADALTSEQKDLLKKEYEKEISKANLGKWENQLRLEYDQIDWDRINEQLNAAVINIRLDSLQKAYTEAIVNLSNLQKRITSSDQNGIPDTDITLQSVQERKEQVQKMLNRVKAVRNKKVIHL